jgi:hypothetical protein
VKRVREIVGGGVSFRFKVIRLGGLRCEEYNLGGAVASDLVYSHLDK